MMILHSLIYNTPRPLTGMFFIKGIPMLTACLLFIRILFPVRGHPSYQRGLCHVSANCRSFNFGMILLP